MGGIKNTCSARLSSAAFGFAKRWIGEKNKKQLIASCTVVGVLRTEYVKQLLRESVGRLRREPRRIQSTGERRYIAISEGYCHGRFYSSISLGHSPGCVGWTADIHFQPRCVLVRARPSKGMYYYIHCMTLLQRPTQVDKINQTPARAPPFRFVRASTLRRDVCMCNVTFLASYHLAHCGRGWGGMVRTGQRCLHR